MSVSFDVSIEVSEQYDFNKASLSKIKSNPWVKNQWPLVYFIQNESRKIAYIGESTNAASRIKNHLANPSKSSVFNKISIIGSDKFNKSATLDIESNLIQYLTSEGTYTLQNGNYGLINHYYYQQDLYKDLFKEIWKKLMEKKVVSRSLLEVENSALFKYSPYKALNEDQYESVLEILVALCENQTNRIFIKGSAGTGKTILATYLIKLLHSDVSESISDGYNEDELREVKYIKEFQERYPNAKIGLVIAMTSLRKSLESVFMKIPGLKKSMIINPSETFKVKEKYDLLIVDEAHRLRKYKNISWMGAFRKNNQKLGLDDTGTELDWILANSRNQIFFYDSAQSVKPSDINQEDFSVLLNDSTTKELELTSQMRVQGGNDYITFVDELLQVNRKDKPIYSSKEYELLVFDTLPELYRELGRKEEQGGLCRLVAGYSWPWLSKPAKSGEKKDDIDIEIDGLQFQWNQTDRDWINSPNAFKEIGCIHTVQGYDLNYTGVIFGKEINYNKQTDSIEIDPKLYFDINGKKGLSDTNDLKSYIINIYKTIMYRGIRGAFIYACNEDLREYLKQHIPTYKQAIPFRILPMEDVKPYVNSVPLVDISAGVGKVIDLKEHADFEWIELPFHIVIREGYFVCKVVGESMTERVPKDSYCLFRQYEGQSTNGKIVLVQPTSIQNSKFASGNIGQEHLGIMRAANDQGKDCAIALTSFKFDSYFEVIESDGEEVAEGKVLGVFECVL